MREWKRRTEARSILITWKTKCTARKYIYRYRKWI